MAEATLNDVMKTMREEGMQTRDTGANSLRVAIDSLNMTVNALGNINNSLKFFTETFLENMKRSRREALLANNARPELLASLGKQSGEEKEKEVDVPKKKGGILASLFGSLGALSLSGIVKSIGGGLLSSFKLLFSPKALLKIFAKFASKFGPIAIVAGIIASISGAISSFMESDADTLFGRIYDGFLGSIGQVIEFFTFGFIKKEQIEELLKPLSDFMDDVGIFVLEMIDQPGIAIDTAIASMKKVGIWFSDVLGDLFESLGLDDLAKTLFGTKVSGEMVAKFFKNLFNPKPEEGYFSIVKLLTDVWDTSKKAVETTTSNVSKFFTNLFSSTPEDGYFSIAKVLSDLFTSAKTTLIAGKESVSKFFSSLFSLTPDEGYFSIAKVLNDLFTSAKTTLIAGKESVSKFFTNLFAEKPEEGYFSIRKVLSDLFTNAKTTLVAGKDTVVKIFTNLFSSEPEDGYFSVVKMVIDAFNSVSNLAETFYTKVQNLVAENIVDPIGNAFTSAGKFMSSLPDRIMLTIEEIWIKTMADLKIGFIKFAGFVNTLPDRVLLAAESALASTRLGRRFVDEEGIKARQEALDAKAGGDQANIDAITAQEAADLEALRLKKAALNTDAITAKKDTDLEAARLKKAAMDKFEREYDAQVAAPVVVSGGSVGQQITGGTHYHGPVTNAPSVTQSAPGGYSSQLPTQSSYM
jgi:predicted SnoaL-like aldol condensation-catalyzing enzyme